MTPKQNVFILGACTFVVAALLFTLYFQSPMSERLLSQGFNRVIDSTIQIKLINTFLLGDDAYYIAGKSNKNLYLANYKRPFELTEISLSSTKQRLITIKLTGVDTLTSLQSFRIFVDSETFFITNGVMPIIMKGNITTWTATPIFEKERNYFVDILPINKSSFALRSYSNASRSFQLGRQSLCDTPAFSIKPGILQKQLDGLIDVHGTIKRDYEQNQLVYLYAYRNEYIILDSTLDNYSRGNTIDTFATAQLKIETNPKTGESMVANPPAAINGVSDVSDNKLYIQSNLLAKNEAPEVFLNNNVLDVYDLKRKEYQRTIYIPNIKSDRITDFKVYDKGIAAVYTNKLLIFELIKTRDSHHADITHK